MTWNLPFVAGNTSVTLYLYSTSYLYVTPEQIIDLIGVTDANGALTPGRPYHPEFNYAKVTINPYKVTSISPEKLSYLEGTTSNIQTQINNVSLNLLNGSNVFTGVFNSIQSADTILPITFSTTPSFSMTTGMVYNLTTSSNSLASLSLTDIPTTPQQTYVFTFVLKPSTIDSPWYLKPPTNFINITPVGGSSMTVPIYGISNVVFPVSYTYILQTIIVVNTSTTTTPTFISFLSVSAY